ncbi:MAG: type II secretion system F family protein [Planctomycetota bacterium]|nr:MAG: type II secretion system F family protein [Planctomycetota bacterium]
MAFDLSQLTPWLIFLTVVFLVWGVIGLFTPQKSRAAERLDELRDPRLRERNEAVRGSSSGVTGMLERAAPTLSNALKPKTELEQNALKVRLANAGFNSANADSVYLTVKMLGLIAGFVAGGGVGLWRWGMTQNGLFSTVIGAGVGFYLPEVVLSLMIRSRQQKIFRSLPDTLDLLVVCVEAGLGLDAAMRRVVEEMQDAAPEICSELALCNMQLQMGRPRKEVLHDLGVRTGVDDVRALVAILMQAERFGASIAKALRVQSDSMRAKRRQMAEEQAQQTAVKLIFPLVLFIFPGIFVVLVGPAAISLMQTLMTD